MTGLRCQVDVLVRQRQQIDVNLSSLQCCLDIINADSELSESAAEAVRQARQHISSCVEMQAVAADVVASSWMWLQRQSDAQLTDSQVRHHFFAFFFF